VPVGDHDLGRVHALGPPAGRAKGRGEQGARLALASRDEGVRSTGRELSERRHRPRDVAVLTRGHVHRGQHSPLRGARGQKRRGQVAVSSQENCRDLAPRRGIAVGGAARALEQEVRHPPQGRDHDHERTRMSMDQLDGMAHRRRVHDGRSPELPDLEGRTALSGLGLSHEPERIPQE
jgi:hypothetical protein